MLRTVAFGDHASGARGVVLGGAQAFAAFAGSEASSAGEPARLDVERAAPAEPAEDEAAACAEAEEAEVWRLQCAAGRFEISSASPARDLRGESDGPWVRAGLCRVEGVLALGGCQRALSCAGVRTWMLEPEAGRHSALRQVLAWFEGGQGVALSALRPRRAPGHGTDLVRAAAFDPAGLPPVAEARLSTTYREGERPVRAGLELWLGESEGEQFPLRVAGEAAGPALTGAWEGLDLQVSWLACHSRGREGGGAYVLARAAG